MSVRTATVDDIQEVYRLCKLFKEISPYADHPISDDHFFSFLKHYLKPNPTEHNVFVYERDGLKGLIAGQITVGSHFFDEHRIATELVWYVEPELRHGMAPIRLLQAYEQWAELMGCKKISLSAVENKFRPTLSRMYEKMGYVSTEETFVRDV
jgi:GNAT superfamily N-acetyltransferase